MIPTNSFSPHTEILPDVQKEIWPLLEPLARSSFVLYGGTAVALQLGHRYSVDFDFFSMHKFENREIYAMLPFLRDAVEVVKDIDLYENLAPETSTLSLVTKSGSLWNIGRVGSPMICTDTGLQVASLEDLMATKITALLSRDTWKDRADIAAMIRAGVSLASGISSSQAMNGVNFDPTVVTRILTNFTPQMVEDIGEKNCKLLAKTASKITSKIYPAKINTWELSAFSHL